ncbi:hypothetical protein MNEG_0899 [Monoraphidium neglectum]|uniref:Uncharacterized protein n=1 Tax=Monoraphidium neglectum TaxID=145388 RepID=A0A0D2LKY7_9CHLO|nr:hypothetical protein MNEG_0899 [Monoraphidium neglectum]KIZ07049.1 hypothetical protein MNEG_0899 [Monoraphidium neglectum]|eukprot:XP_013906068.1 hypothetical protein MNEG_0899 [Monoraphidium neglectum]
MFIGNFVGDKRQGLGVRYLVCKGKKYVAEWVDDKPVCGTVLALDSADLEPPSAHGLAEALAREAARRQLSKGGAGPTGADSNGSPAPLPVIYLSQPSKVLAREFVAVRAAREARAARPPPPTALPGAALQAAAAGGDATLAAQQVELLRHAFTLMAGDDGRRARLLPRQLPELAVLAGLDPAARPTVALLDQVRTRCRSDAAGGVSLDALLHAAVHFRMQPLAPAAESGAGPESQGGAGGGGLLSLHDIQEGDAGGGGGAAEGPACSARSCGDWAAGGPVSDRTGTDGEVCEGVQQGAASQVATVGSAGIQEGAAPQHETAATEPAEEQWAPAPLDVEGREADDSGSDEASTMVQGQEEEAVPLQEYVSAAAAEEGALPPAAGAQVGADGNTAAGADVAALGAPVPADELVSNSQEHSQQQLRVARGGAGEERAQQPWEGATRGEQDKEGAVEPQPLEHMVEDE